MEVPDGIDNVKPNIVCKLRKALYGLRQSPRCWYDRLHQHLVSINLNRSQADPCLYFCKDVFLLIHVDDLILLSDSEKQLQKIKGELMKNFEMRDLTNESNMKFLGLNISRTEDQLLINQRELIQKILTVFNMNEAKASSIPIQPNLNLSFVSQNQEHLETYLYRQLIGYLIYFGIFQKNFSSAHWQHLKHVLRYLKSTENVGLKFCKSNKNLENILLGYVDADFANSIFPKG